MDVPASKAREAFGDLVSRAAFGKERVVLTRRGKALAALVPIEDLEMIRAAEDRIDVEAAREALAEPERVSATDLAARLRSRRSAE